MKILKILFFLLKNQIQKNKGEGEIMIIRIPSKPIGEMSIQELFAEFTMVPLYNIKKYDSWNDWSGEKRCGNAYYFACIFHSEADKFDFEIEDIIAMDDGHAKWAIEQVNKKREDRKKLRDNFPKYLKEFSAEESPPIDLTAMPLLSEYDPSTTQIEYTLESYRNMDQLTVEMYEFALYFGFRFWWQRSMALHKIVCKIMMYPKGYSFGDKEVKEIMNWWEADNGQDVEKISTMFKNHPRRDRFWYLTKKIKENLKECA